MEIESRMVDWGKATDAWNHGPECENIDMPAQSVETSAVHRKLVLFTVFLEDSIWQT